MADWKGWGRALSVLAIGMILIFGFIRAIAEKGFGSSDAAGWMQAIGTVAAVAAAIWLSAEQLRQQEARELQRELAEVDGMLRSIRSEIDAAILSVQRQIGPLLENSLPGTPFLVTFPITEQPFPVYHGLIPKIGVIKDSALRKQIVYTYGRGQGLVMTFRHNNELIDDYVESRRLAANGSAFDREVGEAKISTLITYADQLRANQKETMGEIAKLLDMLPAD